MDLTIEEMKKTLIDKVNHIEQANQVINEEGARCCVLQDKLHSNEVTIADLNKVINELQVEGNDARGTIR
jgi:hypothetical protein